MTNLAKISAAKPTLVATLKCAAFSPRSYLQGAQQDPKTGDWLLAQARMTTGSAQHTVYHRFSAKGAYLGAMTLHRGGHGSSFGFDLDGFLITAWDRTTSAGKVTGRDLVRLEWRKGTLKRSASGVEFLASPSKWAIPAVDARHGLIATRRVNSSGVETYTLHRLADLRAGKAKAIRTIVDKTDRGTFQGFGSWDGRLYRLYGATDRKSTVREHEWATGKTVVLDVTGVSGARSKREVEGLGAHASGLTMGVRVGDTGKGRVFHVYRLLPFEEPAKPPPAKTTRYVVTASTLNGRKGPSTKAAIKTQRKRGFVLGIVRSVKAEGRTWLVTEFNTYYAAEYCRKA